jgi:hypothetical protein
VRRTIVLLALFTFAATVGGCREGGGEEPIDGRIRVPAPVPAINAT